MAATKKTFKPTCEALEDRITPYASLSGGILTVTENNAANNVLIRQNDAANKLTVICDNYTQDFASSAVTQVRINTLGGNDTINYQLLDEFSKAKDIRIDAGFGSDTVAVDFSKEIHAALTISVQADVLGTAPGTPLSAATLGLDRLFANFAKIDSSPVTLTSNLGFGDDDASVKFLGDITGSSNVSVNLADRVDLKALNVVLARGGNDKLTVDALTDVDIDDNAKLNITIDGRDGNDIVDVKYQGELDGQLKAKIDGMNGTDVVSAVITAADDSEGTVDAAVHGGAGIDTVKLQILGDLNELAIVQALLDGGAGIDTCIKTANVTAINCEA